VTLAASSSEALTAAQMKKFDLVISDIGLPDGSGLDLIKKIMELQKVKGKKKLRMEN
jgi:YesN/AraC family two-component response regulator